MDKTVDWWVVLLASLFATLGFAIIWNNKYKHLLIVSIGGVVCCAAYLFTEMFTNDIFISVMVGSMVATIMSEILARILKSPATVFLIPTIIPFVPGAMLFFMMYNLIKLFYENFSGLGLASLGIAVGIILASVIFQIIFKLITKITNKFSYTK